MYRGQLACSSDRIFLARMTKLTHLCSKYPNHPTCQDRYSYGEEEDKNENKLDFRSTLEPLFRPCLPTTHWPK